MLRETVSCPSGERKATLCQGRLANLQSRGLRTDRSLLLILDGSKALRPSAAESVREGLDETLTVLTLNLSPRLRRSLATTNAAESLLSRTRHVKRNVKRWRGGPLMLRWVAAGVLEAVKGFRRLKGYADMPTLVTALRTRDRQLGLLSAETDGPRRHQSSLTRTPALV